MREEVKILSNRSENNKENQQGPQLFNLRKLINYYKV